MNCNAVMGLLGMLDKIKGPSIRILGFHRFQLWSRWVIGAYIDEIIQMNKKIAVYDNNCSN